MTDLIDRQALIGVFAGLVPYAIDSFEDSAYARGLDAGYQALVAAPAVDAEPVKRGRWIEKHHTYSDEEAPIEEWQSAECSVCGKYHTTPYMYYFTDYNFCPHCGAKMEVEGCTE